MCEHVLVAWQRGHRKDRNLNSQTCHPQRLSACPLPSARSMKIRVWLSLVMITSMALMQASCIAADGGVADGDNEEEVDSSEEALALGKASTTGWKDIPSNLTAAQRQAILDKYEDVPHTGIRHALYDNAVLFYDTNYDRIEKKDSLVVIDFSKHSGQKRFFIMDMKNKGPVKSYVMAHGENSDTNNDGIATSFSNVNGSFQSSVGFYVTAETYISPRNGESLRLDGLSPTNSNARMRAIVIHKAAYVETGRAKQGLSQGCPALPLADGPTVIGRIKGGTVMYAMN